MGFNLKVHCHFYSAWRRHECLFKLKRKEQICKTLKYKSYVIEEKNNSIDLSDKGIAALSTNTSDEDFFVLPDIGFEIKAIEDFVN